MDKRYQVFVSSTYTDLKDGRGAGYGMVAWSFSAFFGPVGSAGFLYGAVSGAVTSSFLP